LDENPTVQNEPGADYFNVTWHMYLFNLT
jgi:hypothetical protein